VLEPDLYFRHFEFAEALRVYLGNPNDAVVEYQKSLALYGGYIPAIHRLGLALIDANKSREAIPHLQRAITLDPTNAEGFAYLGIAFGKSNQCNQAIPYFDQALKFDPNNSIAQRGLADCKSGKSPELAPVAPPTVPLIVPTLVPPK
jgi:Flp pilus assembly protein TadD